ncbi:MAG: hypothetical protein SO054_07785 [Ruminococcus callidus]|nr:hypothetical protein [Ruminococcus callidus]
MDRKQVKKQIIEIVQGMKKQIGQNKLGELFAKDAGSKTKIGCNQFRDIASICHQADCYEEVKLLVQYSTAKANKDVSWKTPLQSNPKKNFGNLVVDCMDEIRKIDPSQELYLLELYFGYLYWQSRIWSEAASDGSGRQGNSRTNNKTKMNWK